MTRKTAQQCGVAIGVGVVLGVAGARFLFVGSALSLVPWGIAGALLGAWSGSGRAAAIVGAVFGFGLSMAFMVAGYSGAPSLASRLPYFVILSLFGAVCGLTAAMLGAFIWPRTVPGNKT